MAQNLPSVFRTGGGNISVNYDWYDAFSGLTYKVFSAGVTTTSAADVYFITPNIDLDGDNYSTAKWQTTVKNGNAELNFDMTIAKPFVIEAGDAYINYKTYSNNSSQPYTIFTIYKVVGVTETQVGTVTTSTSITPGGSTHTFRRMAKITTTQTVFSAGDILRLEMKMYEGANQNTTWYYLHGGRAVSTEDGTGSSVGTDLLIALPIRIDL